MAFLDGLLGGGSVDARNPEQRHLGVDSMQILRLLSPQLIRQIMFMMKMQPYQEGALQQTLGQLGTGAKASRVDRFNASADENAAKGARQAGLFAKESGAGSGSTGGVLGNFAQDAAKQKNAFFAQEYSPEGYARDAAGVTNAFGNYSAGAGQSGNLYGMLAGLINGQPGVQQQPGIGELLGQLAGSWATGGFR